VSWQEDPGALLAATGEGLGNRFVIARAADLHEAGVTPAALARAVCGEVWDGLLVVGSFETTAAKPAAAVPVIDAEIINRDGSPGGTCLNGLRVLAVLSDLPAGIFRMDQREVSWRRVGDEIELMIAGADVPQAARQPFGFELLGRRARVVEFWNPHCVVEVDDPAQEDLQAFFRAARERSDLFPEGVNLELVTRVQAGKLQMRVCERGVGETEACGSGAVAAALAAWSEGQRSAIEVQMPGGSLLLQPAPSGGLQLCGGASVRRLVEESETA
jgi:diaminopimelate epimerase